MGQKGGYREIDSAAVNQIAEEANDEYMIVDVRAPEEYICHGSIKNSKLLPLQSLPMAYKKIPRTKKLILVSQNGEHGEMACQFLAAQGYKNLHNLVDGLMNWPFELMKYFVSRWKA